MAERTIEGRYRLIRELGSGAMGEVWLARDLELERDIALKLLAPRADRARFEREARAGAALADPNVTRLYDYGETEGRPFIVLEYLPGGTLEDRLSAGQRLDDPETASIATQLATGLAHAHANGLVHRDLKPANVLFDDEGRPKISDFGIASVVGASTLTDEGTVLGTAAYISPEQVDGKAATAASDVYAFGVILFRMLTGRLPFESDSALELADMHRRLDAPPIERFRRDAPPNLAAVATAALARDRHLRPQDGAALIDALGGPAAAQPTDAPTIVIRPPARGARPLAIAGGVLLLAVVGAAAALLLTRPSSGGQTHNPPPSLTRNTSTAGTSTATTASTTTTATGTTASTTSTSPSPVTPPAPAPPAPPPPSPPPPPTTAATTTTVPGP